MSHATEPTTPAGAANRVHWMDGTIEGPMRKCRFVVEANGRQVPAVLWIPAHAAQRVPLVLIGHGGSQHKEAAPVLDVAVPLVRRGFAVAAIDGPVHGERRGDKGQDGPLVLKEFRAYWHANPGTDRMAADWQATLAALAGRPEIDGDRVGWWGVSMGTAYGLPVCAAEPRIRAAVFGMWGTRPLAHGEVLLEAARQVRCPVQFQRKLEDERFDAAGQEALFAALGSPTKELRTYPGAHTNPEGVQLEDALDFLCAHLGPDPSR